MESHALSRRMEDLSKTNTVYNSTLLEEACKYTVELCKCDEDTEQINLFYDNLLLLSYHARERACSLYSYLSGKCCFLVGLIKPKGIIEVYLAEGIGHQVGNVFAWDLKNQGRESFTELHAMGACEALLPTKQVFTARIETNERPGRLILHC